MGKVLITGASSGIGRKLTDQFAAHGRDLVLCARNEQALAKACEELEQAYKIKASYVACDLAEDCQKVYDFCRKEGHEIDVLVNNAGFGDYGLFDQGDVDKFMDMIDLNDKALVKLTYLFVQDMKKHKSGYILNTGSVAGFLPGPYMAVYYATKAFVMSFSLALRKELKKDGITVSVLCPAPTRSAFWERANGKTTAVYDNVFARSIDDAARTGYRLYEKKKAYAIDGFTYRLLIGLARHLPLDLCAGIVGLIQSKTKSSS